MKKNSCEGCCFKDVVCDASLNGKITTLRMVAEVINRLQAENEELKSAINGFRGYEDKIKAEAYKEFADLSIKRICEDVSAPTPSESYIVEKCNQTIYNLLKELVGDT